MKGVVSCAPSNSAPWEAHSGHHPYAMPHRSTACLRDGGRVERVGVLQAHQLAQALDGTLVQVGGLQAAVVIDKQVHQHLQGFGEVKTLR